MGQCIFFLKQKSKIQIQVWIWHVETHCGETSGMVCQHTSQFLVTRQILMIFIRKPFKAVIERRQERWKGNHWLHKWREAEDSFLEKKMSCFPVAIGDQWASGEENWSSMKQKINNTKVAKKRAQIACYKKIGQIWEKVQKKYISQMSAC